MIENTLHDFLFRRLDGMISLKKGLDSFALRHKVTSANIANVETPRYKAQKVEFEEELRKALDHISHGVSRTHQDHIPVKAGLRRLERVEAEVTDDDTPSLFNGINNVDVEKEMAQMATNQIHYAAASKVMGIRYRMLSSAIRGQR